MLPVFFPDLRHPERMLTDVELYIDQLQEPLPGRSSSLPGLGRDLLRSVVLIVHDMLWSLIASADLAAQNPSACVREQLDLRTLPSTIDAAVYNLYLNEAHRHPVEISASDLQAWAVRVWEGVATTTLRELGYRGMGRKQRARKRFDELYPVEIGPRSPTATTTRRGRRALQFRGVIAVYEADRDANSETPEGYPPRLACH